MTKYVIFILFYLKNIYIIKLYLMSKKKINNIKKTENNIKKTENTISNFKLFNKFNHKWEIIFKFCINYFQQYNYSKSIINIVRIIYFNKSFCIIFFILTSLFWSNLVLNLVYNFMMIDSLIISLLILQNNCIETNSRRLAKNILLMSLTSLNLIGGILTLIMVSFIYMEYGKFFGRLIFKFIKFFIKITGNIFPPVYLLYPDIKLFNFEDPDMTIRDEPNKKHVNIFKPSSSDSDSDSDSPKLKKKKYIKTNKKLTKLKNKNKSTGRSSFPTISTIKYDVFKDKALNINLKKK